LTKFVASLVVGVAIHTTKTFSAIFEFPPFNHPLSNNISMHFISSAQTVTVQATFYKSINP